MSVPSPYTRQAKYKLRILTQARTVSEIEGGNIVRQDSDPPKHETRRKELETCASGGFPIQAGRKTVR